MSTMQRAQVGPLLTLVASATLVLAGCTAAQAGSASGLPVQTAEVSMPPSYRFDPTAIQVVAGTQVTFSNSDNFIHSVQVQGRPDHLVKPGDRIQIAFDTPGEFPYACTLHSQNMRGTVMVTAS
jgi:plastocyanin